MKIRMTESLLSELRANNQWWCGWCESVVPVGYWHRCDTDGSQSGPTEDLRHR